MEINYTEFAEFRKDKKKKLSTLQKIAIGTGILATLGGSGYLANRLLKKKVLTNITNKSNTIPKNIPSPSKSPPISKPNISASKPSASKPSASKPSTSPPISTPSSAITKSSPSTISKSISVTPYTRTDGTLVSGYISKRRVRVNEDINTVQTSTLNRIAYPETKDPWLKELTPTKVTKDISPQISESKPTLLLEGSKRYMQKPKTTIDDVIRGDRDDLLYRAKKHAKQTAAKRKKDAETVSRTYKTQRQRTNQTLLPLDAEGQPIRQIPIRETSTDNGVRKAAIEKRDQLAAEDRKQRTMLAKLAKKDKSKSLSKLGGDFPPFTNVGDVKLPITRQIEPGMKGVGYEDGASQPNQYSKTGYSPKIWKKDYRWGDSDIPVVRDPKPRQQDLLDNTEAKKVLSDFFIAQGEISEEIANRKADEFAGWIATSLDKSMSKEAYSAGIKHYTGNLIDDETIDMMFEMRGSIKRSERYLQRYLDLPKLFAESISREMGTYQKQGSLMDMFEKAGNTVLGKRQFMTVMRNAIIRTKQESIYGYIEQYVRNPSDLKLALLNAKLQMRYNLLRNFYGAGENDLVKANFLQRILNPFLHIDVKHSRQLQDLRREVYRPELVRIVEDRLKTDLRLNPTKRIVKWADNYQQEHEIDLNDLTSLRNYKNKNTPNP